MKARDIMTSNPAVVTPDEPIKRAAELMRERDVGLIPVVSDRADMQLQGVVTDRDIAVRCVAAGHGGTCKVRDHMTTDRIGTVKVDADIDEVIHKMEKDKVRRIPVTEDGNRLTGIIAQADLALRLGPKEPLRVEEVLEAVSAPSLATH